MVICLMSGKPTRILPFLSLGILIVWRIIDPFLSSVYCQRYWNLLFIPKLLLSLSPQQFGFLSNRSTVSQQLLSISKILENCDRGVPTDLVYFDFRKAIDSVPHSILLYKLWSIEVTGPLWLPLWHWFKCYLSNRHHFVQLETHSSSLLSGKSGVPQGSILGPLLFLIFANDLPERISYSSLLLFADDSKIQNAISSPDDIAHLQSDIDALVSGLIQTLYSSIPKSVQLLGFHCCLMHVINISVPSLHCDLGITVKGDLSWSSHHNFICSKA